MKYFFSLLIVLVFLSSCAHQAARFNDQVVASEKEVQTAIKTTQPQLDSFFKEDDYAAVAQTSTQLVTLIDAKLAALNNAQTAGLKKSDEFKKAATDYLTYTRTIYTGYQQLAAANDPALRQAKRHEIKQLLKQNYTVSRNLQVAQVDFANANAFKLK